MGRDSQTFIPEGSPRREMSAIEFRE